LLFDKISISRIYTQYECVTIITYIIITIVVTVFISVVIIITTIIMFSNILAAWHYQDIDVVKHISGE